MCETSFRCGVSFDHSAARRGISPPAGGEFLSQRWERNQWPRPPSLGPAGQFTLRIAGGRLRMDTSCPYSPYPWSPITGVIPWSRQNPSGAQNQECLGAIPSGPTGGLNRKKIGTGAILFLRLPLLNQRPGAVPAVGAAPCGRPQAFPLVGGRWLAFGQPDEGGLLAEAISGGSPKGLPYSILGLCRGGTLGRSGTGPYEANGDVPVSA